MASTSINWQVNGKRITGESLLQIDMISAQWQTLISTVTLFADFFGLKKMDFDIIAGTDPPEYTYTFTSSDNRKWKQRIIFDAPTNPIMNFDVDDYFRLSEFEPQRAVRAALIALVAQNQLQHLSVRWN